MYPQAHVNRAGNLHNEKIDNPAVDPATEHRQAVLHVLYKPVVGIVNVKPIGKERDDHRILRRVAVEEQRQTASNNEHR